jgi:hypothetical protein
LGEQEKIMSWFYRQISYPPAETSTHFANFCLTGKMFTVSICRGRDAFVIERRQEEESWKSLPH